MHPVSATEPSRSPELDWLTALRIFAALWVVLHHFGVGISGSPSLGWLSMSVFLEQGSMGVGVFFVLSGFILSHAYSHKPGFSAKAFFVNRFARIYPVYVLALVLAVEALIAEFSIHIAHHGASLGVMMASLKAGLVLTLTQAWIPSAALFWNGVSWSLSAEMFFYASFPWLSPRLRNLSSPMLFGVIGICLGLQGIATWSGVHGMASLGSFFPAFRIPNFILGMCVQTLVSRSISIPKSSAFLLLPLFLLLHTARIEGNAWVIAREVGSYALIAALIASLSTPSNKPTRSWWMSILVLLGNASYAMYLLQFPLMNIWKHIFPTWSFASFLGYIAFLIGSSILVFLRLEQPLRGKIRSVLLKR